MTRVSPLLTLMLLALALPVLAGPLGTGDPVPDFALVDSGNRTVHLREFRGKTVLVTFLYTRCPVPTQCPAVMRKLTQVRQLIDKIPEAREKFQVLSITLDPERDTPERLEVYATTYGAAVPNWKFLTGRTDQIEKVAGYFGVLFAEEEGGLIKHNMRTGLIDADGRLALVLSGSDWKPGELAATIREMLK